MTVNKTILNFIIEKDLLEKIEDFRFKNRFATRAAAIKWLLAWALKQKPSTKSTAVPVEEEESRPPVPEPVIAPPPIPVSAKSGPEPSQESAIQELKDRGYEVGEIAQHPDGKLRIAVRSRNGFAWVNVEQELAELASGRTNLREVAARRAAGR